MRMIFDAKRGWARSCGSALLFAAFVLPLAAAPLPIAKFDRKTPVDFHEEIVPILKTNCTACHNKTTTKGGLNMETPQLMLKGGESGPAIEPGKGKESLLLQSAAHEGDSDMPPKGNKVGAVNLTPEELALLKLWIDQGAKAGEKKAQQIAWQALPPRIESDLRSRYVTGWRTRSVQSCQPSLHLRRRSEEADRAVCRASRYGTRARFQLRRIEISER